MNRDWHLKLLRKEFNNRQFSCFCSKHGFRVLIRTALMRQFEEVPTVCVFEKNNVYPCKPPFPKCLKHRIVHVMFKFQLSFFQREITSGTANRLVVSKAMDKNSGEEYIPWSSSHSLQYCVLHDNEQHVEKSNLLYVFFFSIL